MAGISKLLHYDGYWRSFIQVIMRTLCQFYALIVQRHLTSSRIECHHVWQNPFNRPFQSLLQYATRTVYAWATYSDLKVNKLTSPKIRLVRSKYGLTGYFKILKVIPYCSSLYFILMYVWFLHNKIVKVSVRFLPEYRLALYIYRGVSRGSGAPSVWSLASGITWVLLRTWPLSRNLSRSMGRYPYQKSYFPICMVFLLTFG